MNKYDIGRVKELSEHIFLHVMMVVGLLQKPCTLLRMFDYFRGEGDGAVKIPMGC